MTRILDRETAREAVRLALPTIELAMTDPATGDSGRLHIVIMNPLADPAAALAQARAREACKRALFLVRDEGG
jgi:hypothetical protein